MDNNRQAMAAKIDALLSKTVENGATEAEAMMAMHKATELMAKYEFNMTSAQIEAQGLDKIELLLNKNSIHAFTAKKLARPICQLTETRGWTTKSPERIVFFGLKPDLIFANWVYETLCNFCTQEADRWWNGPTNYIPSTQIKSAAERTRIKKSFIDGAIYRISNTIRKEVLDRKLAREGNNRAQTSGTALVVIDQVKKDAIEKALAHMKFHRAPQDRSTYYAKAHGALASGYAAGAKASWTKPINNGTGTKLLT